MKPSSNVCGTTTKVPSKRDAKKQINIRWNSRIFFQVGLIVSLLAMFFVMELEIGVKAPIVADDSTSIWEEPAIIDYVIAKEPVTQPKNKPLAVVKRPPVKATPAVSNTVTIVDDNTPILEGKTIAEGNMPVSTPSVPSGADTTPATKNIMGVEFVPVFPGCEGITGKAAKIDCMSSKIRAFISKKFEADKFDYFEPGSIQNIHTMFTIDTNGAVVDIQARAKDKKLEAEAQRVIGKLPVMEPGRQGTTAVNVTYSVPISFKVNY